MRLFFRIVISTCLALLLILKTGQFFYFKYFNFESNFGLLPSNTNYAISLNKKEVLRFPDLKVKYHLTNFHRFNSKQNFKTEKDIQENIFANVTCLNKQNSFVTIFPNLKPSQILVSSSHKLIDFKNNLYLTDPSCELSFDKTSSFEDLTVNIAKSKIGYVFISQNFINEKFNFLPIKTDLVGAFNKFNGRLILNSYAEHNLKSLEGLKYNLDSKDLSCLNPNLNFLSIKEPMLFFDRSNFKSLKFIDNFNEGIQVNFDKTIQVCNNNKIFTLKEKAELNNISKKLPDNSIANYYKLDLSKLFNEDSIQVSKAFYDDDLLKISDLFLQYVFPSFKTQSYFNFLNDSLNSITVFYE